jgi:RimJ/RimL family protein N-acetyltransferase
VSASDPVLIDFPDEFSSERLLIRPPRPGDGRELNQAVKDSFPRLKLWMPWAQRVPTVEESEELCRKAWARFLSREDLHLLLFLKDKKTIIGSSGLHRIDWTVPKFEIGYWVRSAYSGKGYITEAVKCITEFGLKYLNAKRLEIHVNDRNHSSCAVAERCGYKLDGILPNFARDVANELYDKRIYSHVPPSR